MKHIKEDETLFGVSFTYYAPHLEYAVVKATDREAAEQTMIEILEAQSFDYSIDNIEILEDAEQMSLPLEEEPEELKDSNDNVIQFVHPAPRKLQ